MYHGDIKLSDSIDIKFTTRGFADGVPATLAGSPAVAAYVDNNTTEITGGITLTVDFDGLTGLNNVRVVASGANGFAVGKNYSLVITAGTVGGTSVVGEVIGSFSVENRNISNAGTTTLGALTITGALTVSDGVAVNAATSNRDAVALAGNGTGAGLKATGGATGPGAKIIGGGTSGDGLAVTTTSGHGFNVAGNGASKHGALFTGGSSGTSDGVKFAAGSGGIDFRATLQAGVKRNTAFANIPFMMRDSVTHQPVTGATVTVTRLIDGGAFGAGTLGSVTEIANGFYRVDAAAGDMNGVFVTLRASATGCDDTDITFITEP